MGAWVADALIVFGLVALYDGLGWAAATVYWLVRDGLLGGRSLGKTLFGLRVCVEPGDRPCAFRESFLRNGLWIVPGVNIVFGLAGLFDLLHEPRGRHWGDRMAATEVVVCERGAVLR